MAYWHFLFLTEGEGEGETPGGGRRTGVFERPEGRALGGRGEVKGLARLGFSRGRARM